MSSELKVVRAPNSPLMVRLPVTGKGFEIHNIDEKDLVVHGAAETVVIRPGEVAFFKSIYVLDKKKRRKDVRTDHYISKNKA